MVRQHNVARVPGLGRLAAAGTPGLVAAAANIRQTIVQMTNLGVSGSRVAGLL